MFRSLTLTDLDPVRGSATLTLDPRGHTTIAGATATGKTVASECLAGVFTGKVSALHPDAERGGFELSTAKVQIRIGTTRKGTGSWAYRPVGAEDWIKVGSYAELVRLASSTIPALAPAADPDLAECIVSPRALEDLYATDRTAFRAMLLRSLPPVDLRARIVAAVPGLTLDALTADTGGKAPRVVPPDHVDYPDALVDTLKRRQTVDNAARDRAEGAANRESAALAKLQANPVAEPDEVAITAAEATVAAAQAWADYDRREAAYTVDLTAADAALTARREWQAARDALPKHRPVADPGAVQVARVKVDEAKALVKKLEAEEHEAAIEAARAEAAAKATAEAERKAEEARLLRLWEDTKPRAHASPAPAPTSNPGPSLFAQAPRQAVTGILQNLETQRIDGSDVRVAVFTVPMDANLGEGIAYSIQETV